MRKIRKDDEVVVLSGKSKGHAGKVLHVISGMNTKEGTRVSDRVLVEGANIFKKHVKPNPQRNVQGGIVEKEAPIDISNIAIFNPATSKADKVAIKMVDGKKIRVYKSNGEPVDS